jgi:hypothetical protein
MIRAAFCRLHGSHSHWMLPQSHVPPQDAGMMCPTVISLSGTNSPHVAQQPSDMPQSWRFARFDLLSQLRGRWARMMSARPARRFRRSTDRRMTHAIS